MYAIFQIDGFQYRAEEGATLRIPLQSSKAGEKVEISDILLVKGEDAALVGTPFVAGAKIQAEVVGLTRGDKLMTFKYKRRTKSRRTMGHKQDYTEIKVTKIVSPKA